MTEDPGELQSWGQKESHTTSLLSMHAQLESREQSGRWHRSS